MYLDNEITENMEALQWLLDKYMKRKTPKKSSAELHEHRESYLSDEGVLAKVMASKQGEKFRKLWNGDISDYPSTNKDYHTLGYYECKKCNNKGGRRSWNTISTQSEQPIIKTTFEIRL